MLNSEEYILCKLTNKDGYTRNQTLWGENITHEATGPSNQALCSDGWIHFYEHPLIAVLMNPIQAQFDEPRLYSCLIEGEIKKDGQLKSGCKKLTTLSRLPLPVITSEQRIEIGIRCTMIVYKEQHWSLWAQKWLSGEDRTRKSAYATYVAANVAHATYAAANVANAAYAAADYVAAAYAAYAAVNYADAAYAADYAVAYAVTYAVAYAADTSVIPLLRIIKEVLKLQ